MEHPKDFKEVEALMSELMRISACNEAGDKLVIELQAKIAHLESERDALRADAARYRWLKAWEKLDGWTDEQIDRESAIDAAIAAKEPK